MAGVLQPDTKSVEYTRKEKSRVLRWFHFIFFFIFKH